MIQRKAGSVARRTILGSMAAAGGMWLFPAHAQPTGTLTIGVLPNVSARVLATHYEPLLAPLSERLGRSVQFATAPNWKDFYSRTKQGDYDVVVSAANVARLAERELGFKPIAQYEPTIPGLLVVKKGVTGDVSTLLKGQTLVFSNPSSLVAFEGLRWLEQKGLVMDEQFRSLQVKADDSVGRVILRGEAVAGVLSGGEFRAHPEDIRNQLVVHTQFADVPGFVVAIHPRTDAATFDALQGFFLKLNPSAEPGKTFFERSGFKGIGPAKADALTSMDAYLAKTRRLID